MTPKEKALELRDKYFNILNGDNLHLNYLIAEKCAVFYVDEVVKELFELPRIPYNIERTWFYRKVKQEIENL